jgi:hypothetical protein
MKEGDETFLLSDPSIMDLLTCQGRSRPEKKEIMVLGDFFGIR